MIAVEGFNSTARYARTTNTLEGSLTMERVAAIESRWTAGGINAVFFSNSGLAGGAGWYMRNLNGVIVFGMGIAAAFVNSPTFSLAGVGTAIGIFFGVGDGATVRLFMYNAATDSIVEVGSGTSMGGGPVYTAPVADLCIGNRSAAGGTPFTSVAGSILCAGGVDGANLTGAERLAIARGIRKRGTIRSSPLSLVWNARTARPPAAQWDSVPAGSPLDLAGSDTSLVIQSKPRRRFM